MSFFFFFNFKENVLEQCRRIADDRVFPYLKSNVSRDLCGIESYAKKKMST